MPTRSDLLLGAFAALFLFGIASAMHARESGTFNLKAIPAFRTQTEDSIRTLGAALAYDRFKNAFSSRDVNFQHVAAHVFGESLYATFGDTGVKTCDPAFQYGCFHGFFLKAVAAEGLGVVSKLDAVCRTNGSALLDPCEHGIGHGILEYLGYGALSQALETCRQTTRTGVVGGCTSGVFMEYNSPLAGAAETGALPEPRPLLNPEKPYEPCPEIADEFQPSCYKELPQWWAAVLTTDFGRLGNLCDALPPGENQSACFMGIAAEALSFSHADPGAAALLCERMPQSGEKTICSSSVLQLI